MSTTKLSRIFIVDDHPENLQLLEMILSQGPYKVSSFITGKEALTAARKRPPDMFLLDVMMPDMDGFELCKHLQDHSVLRELPVLFISALHDSATKSRALGLGGVDYITKPFLEEEVLARISTHLRLYTQKRELSDAYARLCELEQARESFIQMLVHDFRSPLSGISMALETLKLEPEAYMVQELAEQSLATLNQLKLMVSTLLDYGRLESASLPIHPRSIRLYSLLDTLSSSLPVHDCVIDVPDNLFAFCDPDLTQRVFQNLISNALRYSSPSDITIHVPAVSNPLTVCVSDKGPGIPAERQKDIFHKFKQLSPSQNLPRKGYGIGLAFCKLAVEAQGGNIGVISSETQGSTFWFTVPASSSDRIE